MWFFALLHLCIQLWSLWTSLPFGNRTFQDTETAFWKSVHDLLSGSDEVRVTKYLESGSSIAICYSYRLLIFSQLYVERCYVIWFYKRLVRYFSYDLQLENTKRKHTERVWGNTEFIENKHERKNKITPGGDGWEKRTTRGRKWPLEHQEIKLTQEKLDTASRQDRKQKGVCS